MNNEEGYIFNNAINKEIRIIGNKNINRAMNDDLVLIELLPFDQWLGNKII